MKCKDAQLAVLAGSDGLPPKVQSHLAACPQCRAFAETHRFVLAATPVDAPRPDLDAAVLRAARIRLRAGVPGRGTADSSLFTVLLRAWHPLAAVAVLVLAGAVVALVRVNTRQPAGNAVAGARPVEHGMPWLDTQLSDVLVSLEADLAFAKAGRPELAETAAATAGGGTGNAGSIDARISELELRLVMEQENVAGPTRDG